MKSIRRGSVLHRWFGSTTPPKNKFFVVIGEDENRIIGYFFINSNVSKFISRNSRYLEMQMHIKRSDYPFLSHDSFIDAHELKYLDKADIMAELQSGKTTHKGTLADEDMERLLASLRESALYSKHIKEKFFK